MGADGAGAFGDEDGPAVCFQRREGGVGAQNLSFLGLDVVGEIRTQTRIRFPDGIIDGDRTRFFEPPKVRVWADG